jgi:4-diphosphocytidyl-2-C-methyl-D-erythritol kinase
MTTNREQFQNVGDGLLVRAPAKINLSLLIAGKRPDGFHEIETIMAKINYFDEILIQPGDKPGIKVKSVGPYWAPQGKENLIYAACDSLLKNCRINTDFKITLTKNIPAGSGLGSASSDAAATLMGVNKFLNLALDYPHLSAIAAELGSDITFFLGGPLAFCTGKGEKIQKLDKIFNFLAILILPNVSSSTKRVYANYAHNHPLYEQLNSQIKGFLLKNRVDLVTKVCTNMLQTTCFHLYEEIAELKNRVESLGLGPLCLSGSGSALFYFVDNNDFNKAVEYKQILDKKIGCNNIIVSNNGW